MIKPSTFETLHWSIAVLLSLLLHAVLVWQQNTLLYSNSGKDSQQNGITRLTFRTLPKPAPPTPAPTPEVIPEIKPEPVKPRPVREASTPKLKKRPTPKPVKKVVAQQVRETEALPAPAAGQPLISQQARNNYLGSLAAHIETYKFYPRAARQRGVQGVIEVSFRLLANGSITDIQIKNGHKLLRTAAEQALQRAQPLPAPPSGMEIPLLVTYGMEYRLR